MALKKLLVALTTTREVEGKVRRVRFAANKVVDLTDDEVELLESLTKKTGKLHFREPIQEGKAKIAADDPEVIEVPDYDGADVPMGKKTVDQLKAYLTFHAVDFASDDAKKDLLAKAEKHEAGADQTGDDLDGGL